MYESTIQYLHELTQQCRPNSLLIKYYLLKVNKKKGGCENEHELHSSTAVALPVLPKKLVTDEDQAATGRYPNNILGPSCRICAELSIH